MAQRYREPDLAVEGGENVATLPPDEVAHVERPTMRTGARTAVSSIHIVACLGDHDELATARRQPRECLRFRVDDEAPRALPAIVRRAGLGLLRRRRGRRPRAGL